MLSVSSKGGEKEKPWSFFWTVEVNFNISAKLKLFFSSTAPTGCFPRPHPYSLSALSSFLQSSTTKLCRYECVCMCVCVFCRSSDWATVCPCTMPENKYLVVDKIHWWCWWRQTVELTFRNTTSVPPPTTVHTRLPPSPRSSHIDTSPGRENNTFCKQRHMEQKLSLHRRLCRVRLTKTWVIIWKKKKKKTEGAFEQRTL